MQFPFRYLFQLHFFLSLSSSAHCYPLSSLALVTLTLCFPIFYLLLLSPLFLYPFFPSYIFRLFPNIPLFLLPLPPLPTPHLSSLSPSFSLCFSPFTSTSSHPFLTPPLPFFPFSFYSPLLPTTYFSPLTPFSPFHLFLSLSLPSNILHTLFRFRLFPFSVPSLCLSLLSSTP